jgi:DNA-binding MarR family transcriptional regulator
MYRLKRLQQALRNAMERSLAEVSLTGPQYAVLAALEANPDATSADLARLCFVTAQTMNEIVQGLTSNGLIRREGPSHGRAVQLNLTGEGMLLLNTAHGRVTSVEDKALITLPREDRERFLLHLDACASALEAKSEPEHDPALT